MADLIIVHEEACVHLHRTLAAIRDLGARSGVALNPATPVDGIRHVLDLTDMVLVMTVNPGFGGQSFIPQMLDKVRRMRAMLDAAGSSADLEVDGGIKPDNVAQLIAAGATVVVAGSAIYSPQRSVAEAVRLLRDAAGSRR